MRMGVCWCWLDDGSAGTGTSSTSSRLGGFPLDILFMRFLIVPPPRVLLGVPSHSCLRRKSLRVAESGLSLGDEMNLLPLLLGAFWLVPVLLWKETLLPKLSVEARRRLEEGLGRAVHFRRMKRASNVMNMPARRPLKKKIMIERSGKRGQFSAVKGRAVEDGIGVGVVVVMGEIEFVGTEVEVEVLGLVLEDGVFDAAGGGIS